jgi:hypothetical protein
LRDLEHDVTITLVAPAGTEEPMITGLIDEYANTNPRITVSSRDPMLNPAFVQSFSSGLEGGIIPNHSIIVQSGAQYRVITPDLLLTPQFDQMGRVVGIASINIERQITTAIHAVTQGELAVVYKVTGSGEQALEPEFIMFLETENFIVRTLDAMAVMRDGIPESADILLLSAPRRDWPTEKADRILAYLESGGRAFIALEPQFGNRMPNFDRVLAAYGIRASDYSVMDVDPRNHIMFPMFILPDMWPHEINMPLAAEGRLNILLGFSGAIEILEIRRAATEFDLLMATSMNAFGRINPEIESFLFHEGEDEEGPFIIGATITDTVFADRTLVTKIVAVGSDSIWGQSAREIVGDNNFAFVASALRWLTEQGPGLFIPTRTPPGFAPLMLNQLQANAIAGFSMGVLPLVTLAVGIFIWHRRRHS